MSIRKINRKTLAKRGGGSGTTSSGRGHNTSSMSSGGLRGVRVRTKSRKPAKSPGGTRVSRHTTYSGGPGIDH